MDSAFASCWMDVTLMEAGIGCSARRIHQCRVQYLGIVAVSGCCIMLRKTFYAMLTVILMIGAGSAQENKPGLPGYTNILRTPLERNNDKEIDSAYQSAKKVIPADTKKKNLIRGAMSAQSQQRQPKTNNIEWQLPAASRRRGLLRFSTGPRRLITVSFCRL
jgi:hypothetical protein